MQKINRYIILLPVCLLLLCTNACKSDKEDTGWMNQSFALDEDSSAAVKDSVDYILGKAMQHNTRFETFSTQMDIKLQAGGFNIGVGGSLRIENDRMIWGTVSKFIEVARFSLTPDSLVLWSKLDNTAVIYTDTVFEMNGKTLHFMPFIYRFAQCFLLCQTDTLMLDGTRTLNSSQPDLWIIDGVVNDSMAWQCALGRNDFRIKRMLVSLKQGGMMQVELSYAEEGGFAVRISADEKQMFSAVVKYNKVKWNEPQTYPIKLGAGTKVQYNTGLIKKSTGITDNL